MRGFEIISKEEFGKLGMDLSYENIILPKRGTKNSAGYDFYLAYDLKIESNSSVLVSSGIKAYMEEDEVLLIVVRSSLGFKGIRLKNQIGVIDSDYYNNKKNEGHILINLENTSDDTLELKVGDRVVQGIFTKYLVSEKEENPAEIRSGGIGSTRK